MKFIRRTLFWGIQPFELFQIYCCFPLYFQKMPARGHPLSSSGTSRGTSSFRASQQPSSTVSTTGALPFTNQGKCQPEANHQPEPLAALPWATQSQNPYRCQCTHYSRIKRSGPYYLYIYLEQIKRVRSFFDRFYH